MAFGVLAAVAVGGTGVPVGVAVGPLRLLGSVRLTPSSQMTPVDIPRLNCTLSGDSVAGAVKLRLNCCHVVETLTA